MNLKQRQQQLHDETAKIPWRELQRFFAQGAVLKLHEKHDLVKTAAYIADDDLAAIEPLMAQGELAAPSNEQARAWYDEDALVWSVVVAPYVLVQDVKAAESKIDG